MAYDENDFLVLDSGKSETENHPYDWLLLGIDMV